MLKKISVSDLEPGMYIIDETNIWKNYLPLTEKSYICTAKIISMLRGSALREVFVDTSKSRAEEKPADERPADIDPAVQFKEAFKNADKIYSEAQQEVSRLLTDLKKHKKVKLSDAEDMIVKISDSVMENQFVLAGLSMMRSKNQYLFEHALSSCILMIVFAKAGGFKPDKQKEFAIGAMLYDIGMLEVSSAVLNKPGELSSKDISQIRSHVVFGYNILKTIAELPQSVLLMAVQHHERIDGSGYPRGISDEKFSLAGQMAAIVDVYTAATTDRGFRKGIPPAEALGKILVKSKNQFNRELVQLFIKSVGIYPFGSLLSLRNGLVGIVTDPNIPDLIHPELKIIYNSEQKRMIQPYSLQLQEYKNDAEYKIRGLVSKEELSLRNSDILAIAGN